MHVCIYPYACFHVSDEEEEEDESEEEEDEEDESEEEEDEEDESEVDTAKMFSDSSETEEEPRQRRVTHPRAKGRDKRNQIRQRWRSLRRRIPDTLEKLQIEVQGRTKFFNMVYAYILTHINVYPYACLHVSLCITHAYILTHIYIYP